MSRTIAVGDIHGHLLELNLLLEFLNLQPEDTLITLGDYVDRGPDSRGVLEKLINLECNLISILGNHDEAMLNAKNGRSDYNFWLKIGGDKAIKSYNNDIANIPYEHWKFLKNCLPFYETDTHIFTHANYYSSRNMSDCDGETLRWESFEPTTSEPHFSGKTIILGHTVQPNRNILDLGYVKVIDTGVYWTKGCLTALDIDTNEIFQFNSFGRISD